MRREGLSLMAGRTQLTILCFHRIPTRRRFFEWNGRAFSSSKHTLETGVKSGLKRLADATG